MKQETICEEYGSHRFQSFESIISGRTKTLHDNLSGFTLAWEPHYLTVGTVLEVEEVERPNMVKMGYRKRIIRHATEAEANDFNAHFVKQRTLEMGGYWYQVCVD